MKNKNIVAFIFARGGSKGLKNKNIKKFAGKPLIAWSIETALSIKDIQRVIVSTDCDKIAKISLRYGAEVPFIRPRNLSMDKSPEWLAWRHALNFLFKNENKLPDAMLSIPTTAPLRKTKDIKKCLRLFFEKKVDAVITVTDSHRNPWFNMVEETNNGLFKIINKVKKNIFRRQDAKKVYDMTTVAYVLKPKFILTKNSLFEGRVAAVKIPPQRAIDIDNKFDFEIAEHFFNKLK